MQIYTVLWDYELKSYWPPELGDLEMSSGQRPHKLGWRTSMQYLFQEIPMTWSEAEGEHKGGAHWPFLESTSVAPRCLTN